VSPMASIAAIARLEAVRRRIVQPPVGSLAGYLPGVDYASGGAPGSRFGT
jgi:hypothetical protein